MEGVSDADQHRFFVLQRRNPLEETEPRGGFMFLQRSILSFVCVLALALSAQARPALQATDMVTDPANDYSEIVQAIKHAKKSVHLQNYHLSHPDVMAALIQKSKAGLDVQVIVDHAATVRDKSPNAYKDLSAAGVPVKLSSTGFSITHSKMMIIDGKVSFVSTINLTRHPDTTRDVGFFFDDSELANALEDIFATDWQNADVNGNDSPKGLPEALVLSPTNSRAKLLGFISSARQHLQLEVENFVDKDMAQALTDAAERGVKVEVVVPRCSFTSADLNMGIAKDLFANGVDVRMMPEPNTADQPYIHAKFIIVDDQYAFVGSENMSHNSLDLAREVGVLFDLGNFTDDMRTIFQSDLARGLTYNNATTVTCSPRPFDVSQIYPGY